MNGEKKGELKMITPRTMPMLMTIALLRRISRVMKKRFLMDTGSEMGMAAIPMPINCCAEIGATFESDCDTRKK